MSDPVQLPEPLVAAIGAKALSTLRAKAALRGIVVTSVGPSEFMVSFRGAWRMADGLQDLREVLRRMGVSDE